MKREENASEPSDKTQAAVCGLYCGACSWFIATTEEPKRRQRLAAHFQYSEEEAACYGCRSDKRLPYCEDCRMFACAAERGLDFCGECEEFPCEDWKAFQSAMPHRIDLWDNLDRIRSVGYQQWLHEIREDYTCPKCSTINSTYDLVCRKCGEAPSCEYVARHKAAIEQYLKKR
ncbi:MAG: DUF3795 domain-containing protein [Desulfobacteraceae bacterium]|jgi:hypothetical protein